jgi:hypothetical protein
MDNALILMCYVAMGYDCFGDSSCWLSWINDYMHSV